MPLMTAIHIIAATYDGSVVSRVQAITDGPRGIKRVEEFSREELIFAAEKGVPLYTVSAHSGPGEPRERVSLTDAQGTQYLTAGDRSNAADNLGDVRRI